MTVFLHAIERQSFVFTVWYLFFRARSTVCFAESRREVASLSSEVSIAVGFLSTEGSHRMDQSIDRINQAIERINE